MPNKQMQRVVDGLIARLVEIEQMAGPVDRALQALDCLDELQAEAGEQAPAVTERFIRAYSERFIRSESAGRAG